MSKQLFPVDRNTSSTSQMDRLEPEARQTRLRRREQEPMEEDLPLPMEDDVDAEEGGEDEEITRCLCRRQEYPGAPIPINDAGRNFSPSATASVDGPDAAGEMFIQCDACKVWQHGGCVGIMSEAMSPDEYFCEICKKDLHKVMTGAKGQRYSRYLPVYELFTSKPSRKSPPSKDPEFRALRERDPDSKSAAAAAAALSSAKKRSTMNSRAALDEEEALRKAIEESKAEPSLSTAGSSVRKGKRGREGSDDTKQDLKRRKAGSNPGSPSDHDGGAAAAESDDEEQPGRTKTTSSTRRPRGAPVQTQREKEKEQKDSKERERDRVEAAGRRKGRADRRNIEDGEAPEDHARSTPVTAAKLAAIPKLSRQATTPKVQASTPSVTAASPSHKKNTRAAPRRGRIGRNQYTRDRDGVDDNRESPRPPTRDGDHGVDETPIVPNIRAVKVKQLNPNRTSMNELKKRVAGMMEFISRTQVELAGETTPPDGNAQPSSTPNLNRPGIMRTASVKGASKLRKEIDGSEEDPKVEEGVFQTMSSNEMLDVLTRRLVHWQKDHGK